MGKLFANLLFCISLYFRFYNHPVYKEAGFNSSLHMHVCVKQLSVQKILYLSRGGGRGISGSGPFQVGISGLLPFFWISGVKKIVVIRDLTL